MKIWLSLCLIGCVRFARHCGKMYSRQLFPTVDYVLNTLASHSFSPCSFVKIVLAQVNKDL